MLRLAAEQPAVRVVSDQIGKPTWARDCAEAALRVAEGLSAGRMERGVLHVAGGGEASWAEFAEAIFAWSAAHGGPSAEVEPVPTSSLSIRARRPLNSRLATERLQQALGWAPDLWHRSLAQCLLEMHAGPTPVG
jgi:dTDP-4-dehydrorhamnose reductase